MARLDGRADDELRPVRIIPNVNEFAEGSVVIECGRTRVHITASVEDADRIIVMEGGRINGIGTHRELMENNEIYREIYTSQNKAGDQDA